MFGQNKLQEWWHLQKSTGMQNKPFRMTKILLYTYNFPKCSLSLTTEGFWRTEALSAFVSISICYDGHGIKHRQLWPDGRKYL